MVGDQECTDRDCPAHGELLVLRDIVRKTFTAIRAGRHDVDLTTQEWAVARRLSGGEEAHDGSTK